MPRPSMTPMRPLTAGRASYTRATETFIADSFCLPDLTVQSLGTMFDTEPGGIIGADYPRTLAAGERQRVVDVPGCPNPHADRGALRPQHRDAAGRSCFSVLVGGSSSHPEAWLFPDDTAPEFRWFWPLDAETGTDGQVYVFATEMHERGERYLERAEPGGVYVARVNPDELERRVVRTPIGHRDRPVRLVDRVRRRVDVPLRALPPPVRLRPGVRRRRARQFVRRGASRSPACRPAGCSTGRPTGRDRRGAQTAPGPPR